MKKLFTSLLFCLGAVLTTHAQFTTIVNSSFSESEPVERGSEQYIDFIITGQFSTASRFRLFIQHNPVDEYESRTNLLELMTEVFHEFYPELPRNEDGSYRVYFNLPEEYPEGLFEISINLTFPAIGRFGPSTVTSLLNPVWVEDTTPEYYTLQGARVDRPSQGIYIRKTGQRTERIYIH